MGATITVLCDVKLKHYVPITIPEQKLKDKKEIKSVSSPVNKLSGLPHLDHLDTIQPKHNLFLRWFQVSLSIFHLLNVESSGTLSNIYLVFRTDNFKMAEVQLA